MKTGLKINIISNCYECPFSKYSNIKKEDNLTIKRFCKITQSNINGYDSDFYLENYYFEYQNKCSTINYFPPDCPLKNYDNDRRLKGILVHNCMECDLNVEHCGKKMCLIDNLPEEDCYENYHFLADKKFPDNCKLKDHEI